jgi:hypothetical protein
MNEILISVENHELALIILLYIIAYSNIEIIGVAIYFYGFSTFKNRKLITIHDFSIANSFKTKELEVNSYRLLKIKT